MEQRLIDANELIKTYGEYEIKVYVDKSPTVLTIPENPTNGDMIKALFPNIEIYDSEKMESVYTGIPFGKYIGANVDCMREWWNAPYKENGK